MDHVGEPPRARPGQDPPNGLSPARNRDQQLISAQQTGDIPRLAEAGPWGDLIDTADIPSGGRLHLYRYDDGYEILFGEEQLMGSWAVRSEEALATVVADRLGSPATEVLIGGLGMGFTLRAARASFPAPASITVAELVPQVVIWARGLLRDVVGDSLFDPRVSIETADVHDVIVSNPGRYDAILLDVDNGPNGLINVANERLYCDWGLRAALAAMRPAGILAIWSAHPDEIFTDRLSRAGLEYETVHVDGGGQQDPPHVIWLIRNQG